MQGETIVRRWFEEVWNQGREATIDELFAPDARMHGLGPPGQVARGPAEFKAFWAPMKAAFSGMRFEIEDVVEQGDKVAVRWTATATHSGDHLGVPATRKAVMLTGLGIARIANGQLVEVWNNWDQHVLAREIGLT